MNLNSMGLRGAQGNESLPMSPVASTAKHKKQQPQAVSDKAMPERMEKQWCSKSKTCVCLVGKGSCLGNVLKKQGAKIEGTRETSPRHSGKLKKSLEVDRSECCCL